MKFLSHQPPNLPLRNTDAKQTCRRRITEKLTSLTQDRPAQGVRIQNLHGNEAREQNNEAEQASNVMSQEAEEQVLGAEERHETSYSGESTPYSDPGPGESVADSPRNKHTNSAESSEPSKSEDSPLDATPQKEQTRQPELRRKREDTESSLGSDAEYFATQGDPDATQGDPDPP